MINLLKRPNSGFELIEERISEVEDRLIEITQYEQHRENNNEGGGGELKTLKLSSILTCP